MRNNRFSLLLGAAVLWGSSLLLTGCDIGAATSAIENVQLIIGLDSIETVVAGQILDAGSGELIDQDVQLSFSGKDKALIIDLFSENLSSQEVSGGMTSFGIKNEASPSTASPVEFQINATANGFEPTSVAVSVSEKGISTFQIYMVRQGQQIEGAASTSQSGQAVSGQVQQQIVAQAAETQTASSAQVTIPQGIVAKDASGNTLSGAITTSLTYFSNQSTQALRSMPGGFNTRTSTGDATLVTGGFASINVTDNNGREATNFSGGKLNVRFDVSGSTINPKTGQPVKNGDAIDVFSFRESDGVWVKEGAATLAGPNANGSFTATHEASHLSWWNAAWESEKCTAGATINVNRNGRQGPIQISITGSGYTTNITIPEGKNSFQLVGAPKNLGAQLSVPGFENLGQAISNLCGGSYTINLPQASNPIDVQFSVVPQCNVSGEAVRVQSIPTTTIMYRRKNAPSGTPWLSAGSPTWVFDTATKALVRGELKIKGLEKNQVYTFKTTYEGETYSADQTITGPSIQYTAEVPDDYCN